MQNQCRGVQIDLGQRYVRLVELCRLCTLVRDHLELNHGYDLNVDAVLLQDFERLSAEPLHSRVGGNEELKNVRLLYQVGNSDR